ncbi:Crp/Fnr family transcriptional regulator [Phenylobacterium sp.]|uniref:Crp/Fnr family transcriptional regulator n=1 Tax=Phenylobacterium sp. TaxID=1871053 RepID=UPI0027181F3C|nr:Crp/Fnr family transcriptional regulator [Phenylobacterium sp.]MDO8801190.1 Crp/Fnr family transcriptional regulator [Phenylobacterium sp.]
MTGAQPALPVFFEQVFACSPEVAAVIAGRAAERRYEPRALILRQGDRTGETFILVFGTAHALLYGRDGQMALLREFAAGDIFGSIAEARPAPEEADIVAAEAAGAAAFLALDFLGLIEAHSCVGLAVSRMLLKQLRAATGKFAERATLSAQGRVYAELLRLARQGDGQTLSPAPVLSALAVRVQTTRETASRAVGALERRGILRRDDGGWIIAAPHRLEDLVV